MTTPSAGRLVESVAGERGRTTDVVRAGRHVDCPRIAGGGETVVVALEDDTGARREPIEEISVGRSGGQIGRRTNGAHRLVPINNCAAPIPSCTRRQWLNPASVSSARSSFGAGRYAVDAGRYR